MNLVIDANVPIVANGRDTHASAKCQLSCVEFLEALVSDSSSDVVVVDALGLVLSEYKGYLNFHGQPGVGDIFYKYLHDHMYSDFVLIVEISKNADERTGFDELPPNALDKNDRKFLACAMASLGTIVNAVDTDWEENKALTARLGVPVAQLCPEHACV